jgi:hypothetical protein
MAQQTGSGVARSGASNRATVAERVRTSLEAMRRSAREFADEVPGVDGMFRLPKANRDQAVLNAARTFAANAEPLEAQFERQMLGPGFFAALAADIAAFEQALSAQRRGRDTRVAATAAIEKATALGMKTVRSLSTLMLNRFGDDPAALAAWKSACKIHAVGGRGPTPAPAHEHTEPVKDAA